MKKFLVYLVVILVAVSVGFTVFYLVRDNETISISTSSIYLREGDVVDDLGIVYSNKKSFSDYEVISSNESIAKYDKENGTLTAVSGGIATITFRTSNIKFRNLSCQVYVGDGSLTSPYYIQTAEALREIGKVTGEGEDATVKYGLDKCYKLVGNINLAEGYNETGYWIPIGTGNRNGFTGNFDGNGYTISNININKQAYFDEVDALENFVEEIPDYRSLDTFGLFSIIGYNGRVCNLKIDNFNISGDVVFVGTIAGENYGTIERCEVLSSYINVTNSSVIGGIVGCNYSDETELSSYNAEGTLTNDYVRYVGRVDRCIANVNIGTSKNEEEDKCGVDYIAGGVVGYNLGGIVIYSYSKGDIYIGHKNENRYVGGIVGYNEYNKFNTTNESYLYPYSGAHVKDCYSIMTFTEPKGRRCYFGGIIGYFGDRSTVDVTINVLEGLEQAGNVSKIVGNYYHTSNLNIDSSQNSTTLKGVGLYKLDNKTTDFPDAEFVVMGKTEGELKTQATYKSHENKEYIKNADTGEYEILTTEVPWKFDTIWYINENLNDGYPTLNFANVEVSDDLFDISDGSVIDSVAELQSMKLDGNYIITADITFGEDDVWIPIGTVNKPFVGTLRAATYVKNGVKDYYKIINLKTVADPEDTENLDREEYEYAGLFGVTSGSNGGKIEDIRLANPTIINGKVVGGIVGSNGYSSSSGNSTKSYAGMSIVNCKVLGGTLTATKKVGAIAGENYGTISSCSAVDYRNNNFSLISNTKVTLYGIEQGYAGGIVGYNGSVVNGCEFTDNSVVIAETADDLMFTVYVGGIAGCNNGNITNSAVTTKNEVAISGLKGAIGGIAGLNQSTIKNVLVSTAINAPVSLDEVYVGGIVGSALSTTSVSNALVKNSSIRGYNAGGLAGSINYSTPNGTKYNLSVDKNYNYKLQNAPDTFAICAVESTVAVEGYNAGGFAAIIDNGIIRNSYTRASLRGINSSSRKAGFAVSLNLNPTTKSVGIIINCYNTCGFAQENGKNFAVADGEILQDPLFDLGMDALKRNVGYCFDYAYVTQDGVTNPTNKDALVNLFKKDPAGTSIGNLQGTAPKHLTNRNFDQTYWTFNADALPTLKGCEGLENSLTNIINSRYSITFGSNVVVRKNNKEIQSGDYIEKGDVLTIGYVETERYSCTSFKINGKESSNNTSYIVTNENVVVEYAEEFSHYDVNVTAIGPGRCDFSKGYAKAGATVGVGPTADASCAILKIEVVTASGKTLTYQNGKGFTMPAENVNVTVTFAHLYTATFKDMYVQDKSFEGKSADTSKTSLRIAEGANVWADYAVSKEYYVESVSVLDADNNVIFDNIVTDRENNYAGGYFIMPGKDIKFVVVLKYMGQITKPSNVTVSCDGVEVESDSKVKEGSVVTIEVTPESGFVVDKIIVTKPGNKNVEVTNNTFVMPNEDVEITVTYVEE